LELPVTLTHLSDGHSERSACITSTRDTRAAGTTHAITATDMWMPYLKVLAAGQGKRCRC
jgi:hypothetical protein